MENIFKAHSSEAPIPPVLLIVFRRPSLTRKMLESIRNAKPPRLYIACDGPRSNRSDDEEKVRAVRSVISEFADELHPMTLYQETNLGCGKGVSTAITWFFEHEEEQTIGEGEIRAGGQLQMEIGRAGSGGRPGFRTIAAKARGPRRRSGRLWL